ncbi:hypothetical protein BCV69DRAFT_282126, partial [Microstroma glucosiphilum]
MLFTPAVISALTLSAVSAVPLKHEGRALGVTSFNKLMLRGQHADALRGQNLTPFQRSPAGMIAAMGQIQALAARSTTDDFQGFSGVLSLVQCMVDTLLAKADSSCSADSSDLSSSNVAESKISELLGSLSTAVTAAQEQASKRDFSQPAANPLELYARSSTNDALAVLSNLQLQIGNLMTDLVTLAQEGSASNSTDGGDDNEPSTTTTKTHTHHTHTKGHHSTKATATVSYGANGVACPAATAENLGQYIPGCPGYGRRSLAEKRDVTEKHLNKLVPALATILEQVPSLIMDTAAASTSSNATDVNVTQLATIANLTNNLTNSTEYKDVVKDFKVILKALTSSADTTATVTKTILPTSTAPNAKLAKNSKKEKSTKKEDKKTKTKTQTQTMTMTVTATSTPTSTSTTKDKTKSHKTHKTHETTETETKTKTKTKSTKSAKSTETVKNKNKKVDEDTMTSTLSGTSSEPTSTVTVVVTATGSGSTSSTSTSTLTSAASNTSTAATTTTASTDAAVASALADENESDEEDEDDEDDSSTGTTSTTADNFKVSHTTSSAASAATIAHGAISSSQEERRDFSSLLEGDGMRYVRRSAGKMSGLSESQLEKLKTILDSLSQETRKSKKHIKTRTKSKTSTSTAVETTSAAKRAKGDVESVDFDLQTINDLIVTLISGETTSANSTSTSTSTSTSGDGDNDGGDNGTSSSSSSNTTDTTTTSSNTTDTTTTTNTTDSTSNSTDPTTNSTGSDTNSRRSPPSFALTNLYPRATHAQAQVQAQEELARRSLSTLRSLVKTMESESTGGMSEMQRRDVTLAEELIDLLVSPGQKGWSNADLIADS